MMSSVMARTAQRFNFFRSLILPFDRKSGCPFTCEFYERGPEDVSQDLCDAAFCYYIDQRKANLESLHDYMVKAYEQDERLDQ